MSTRRAVIGIILVLLVAAVIPSTGQAASGITADVGVDTVGPDCASSGWLISFGWTATTHDFPDTNDGVAMIAYDGNGVAIAADWNGWPVGSTFTEHTPFGAGHGINAITARPITIEVFDLEPGPVLPLGENTQAIYDAIVGRAAPLAQRIVYDPAEDIPDCGTLPLIQASGPVPGCDVTIAIPAGTVGATTVADAVLYWTPGQPTGTVLPAGKNVRAIGLDSTGAYYKIIFVCDYLWVKAETLGPNFESPWNGAPLPTGTVN